MSPLCMPCAPSGQRWPTGARRRALIVDAHHLGAQSRKTSAVGACSPIPDPRRAWSRILRPRRSNKQSDSPALGIGTVVLTDQRRNEPQLSECERQNRSLDSAITVRKARHTDVEAIELCIDEAYEMYVERVGRRPAPMLNDCAALVAEGVVHVATLDGDVAGVIVMWAQPDHCYIDNVATTLAARGSGVGRKLLSSAEDRARADGFDEVRLYTNAAMTENLLYTENFLYYVRHGFVETHRGTDEGFERIYFSKKL